MRCFFHLVDSASTIRDEHGIEVADLEQARAEAINTIREFRAEEPATNLSGWKLMVADAAGTPLVFVSLDSLDHS
jgi:hypothetical protein